MSRCWTIRWPPGCFRLQIEFQNDNILKCKELFTLPNRLCVISCSSCCSFDPTIGTRARIAHLPIVVVSPLLIESIRTSTSRLEIEREKGIIIRWWIDKERTYSIRVVLIEPGPSNAPNSAKIPKTNVPKNNDHDIFLSIVLEKPTKNRSTFIDNCNEFLQNFHIHRTFQIWSKNLHWTRITGNWKPINYTFVNFPICLIHRCCRWSFRVRGSADTNDDEDELSSSLSSSSIWSSKFASKIIPHPIFIDINFRTLPSLKYVWADDGNSSKKSREKTIDTRLAKRSSTNWIASFIVPVESSMLIAYETTYKSVLNSSIANELFWIMLYRVMSIDQSLTMRSIAIVLLLVVQIW